MSPANINHANRSQIHLDALVVGAGFGGCYLLHLLRNQGLKVKIVDNQDAFGGVWRANNYPGARVDCTMPYYLLSAPELMKDWTWTEKYPSGDELRRYFDHVDKVWGLSKDTMFNTRVTESNFDESDEIWHVAAQNGHYFTCRWLFQATGSSHTQHLPNWPGKDSFKGEMYHPASWPRDNPIGRMKGKRVAVIGAGASAIQIVQEAAKVTSSLTNFIRSPNLTLPMRQRQISPEEVESVRPNIQEMHKVARGTNLGLPYWRMESSTLDATSEEREKVWRKNWEEGGFAFSAASFGDISTNKEANALAYGWWAREQSKRVSDPVKRELLIPSKQPYWFGTKRPSMEQDYYEMISLPHVEVTNSPIKALDETGIVTEDGEHREFDLIAVATGYDAVTGPLLKMKITGRNAQPLDAKWSKGVRTQLGMSVAGFPNMFFVYGPQAPTAFTAGTPFIEQQCEWIAEVVSRARKHSWKVVEATAEAEEEWTELNRFIANKTLQVETDSWYMGANIPGKVREPLLFLGGMRLYFDKCREAFDGMKGFSCKTSDQQHTEKRGKL